jgi:hypothetical protein
LTTVDPYQPIPLTVTVSSSGSQATGNVIVYSDAGFAGNGILSGGVSNVIVHAYGENKNFTAIYQGSPAHLPSRSNTVHFEILPAFVGVVSRKSHGVAGPFDIPIDAGASIGGVVTVEPRAIGPGHAIVFQFDRSIGYAGTATCTDALGASIGSIASVTASGTEVTVLITGVPDNRRVTVSLAGVSGPGSLVSASLGLLVGDVDGNLSVTASDILAIKGRQGIVDGSSYWSDLDLSGGVSPGDVAQAKARSGLSL